MSIIRYLAVILRYYCPEVQSLHRRISADKPDEQLQALQHQLDEEVIKLHSA